MRQHSITVPTEIADLISDLEEIRNVDDDAGNIINESQEDIEDS